MGCAQKEDDEDAVWEVKAPHDEVVSNGGDLGRDLENRLTVTLGELE